MRTIIHSQGISITDAIRNHLERRLTTSLRRFEQRISFVEVYIRDLNGSDKGGEDKRVLLKVHVPCLSAVVVENASDDLYKSISVAARRAKRALQRALSRQQRIERKQFLQKELDRLTGLTGVRVNSLHPLDKP
ncbi:MAG: HPF/RaiA family ribosome-associated protein [Gammaproteobacteria bacterium]|nr:HPF/RaiA family ribosome-associated protein [Gammaproteobacteria bacterium]